MVDSNSNTLRNVKKADIPLETLVLLIVGLDRKLLLMICRMALYTEAECCYTERHGLNRMLLQNAVVLK
jgi:hypothetical protein